MIHWNLKILLKVYYVRYFHWNWNVQHSQDTLLICDMEMYMSIKINSTTCRLHFFCAFMLDVGSLTWVHWKSARVIALGKNQISLLHGAFDSLQMVNRKALFLFSHAKFTCSMSTHPPSITTPGFAREMIWTYEARPHGGKNAQCLFLELHSFVGESNTSQLVWC